MESIKKTPYLLTLLLVAAPFTHLVLPHSHIPLSFIVLSLLLATADKKSPHITFATSLVAIVIQMYVLHRINAPMNIIHFIAFMATMALFLMNDQTLQQSIRRYRKKHMEIDMTQANSRVLRDMIKRTIDKETVSDAARQIIKTLIQYYHFDHCTIFMSDSQNQLMVKGTSESNQEILSLEIIAQERLNEMKRINKGSVFKNKEASLKCVQSLKRNVQYSYFHPIFENKDLVAALLVENKNDKNMDKTIQGSFFKLIIDNVHLILKNTMNHEHVIRLTMTDSLTGAYNQKYLDHVLNQKLTEYENTDKSFTIALIDVDHLGQLNQDYGHSFGDLVLKELVSFIRNNVRLNVKGDMIFRFKNDKFAIYFADVKAESIYKPLNNLREKLATQTISNDMGQSVSISASFGLAEYPASDNTAKGLLEKAEKALQESKDKGRNAVTVYIGQQKNDPSAEYQYLLEN